MNLTWLFSWRSKKQQNEPKDAKPERRPDAQSQGSGANKPAVATRPPATNLQRPFEVQLNIGR